MHADSLISVIKRLTSPPMNVSKVYIPLMNSALHIQRVELPKAKDGLSFGRRVRTIWEIEDYDQYREVAVWNPRSDTFETWFENSYLLEKIAAIKGVPRQDLLIEIEKRREYLAELIENDIRDQEEVAERILAYYTNQKEYSKKEQDTKKKRKLSVKRKRYFEEARKEDKTEDIAVKGGDDESEIPTPHHPREKVVEPKIGAEPLTEEES